MKYELSWLLPKSSLKIDICSVLYPFSSLQPCQTYSSTSIFRATCERTEDQFRFYAKLYYTKPVQSLYYVVFTIKPHHRLFQKTETTLTYTLNSTPRMRFGERPGAEILLSELVPHSHK